MKTYDLWSRETTVKMVSVEAESQEQALELARAGEGEYSDAAEHDMRRTIYRTYAETQKKGKKPLA